eukprot:m.336518 g.336518  ORF g.336518 m.336518 type:complete len:184 (+) comp17876_c0_seq1:189-740(+)
MSVVIFLDCDGVLSNHHAIEASFNEEIPFPENELIRDTKGNNTPLEKRCVKELQRIVKETGARVVLSTSWRLFREMREFLVNTLKDYKIEVDDDDTPALRGGRGWEIKAWLNEHPKTENYVILEDSEANIYSIEDSLPPGHVVKTELRVDENWKEEGLTTEAANKAIAILKSQDLDNLDQIAV